MTLFLFKAQKNMYFYFISTHADGFYKKMRSCTNKKG